MSPIDSFKVSLSMFLGKTSYSDHLPNHIIPEGEIKQVQIKRVPDYSRGFFRGPGLYPSRGRASRGGSWSSKGSPRPSSSASQRRYPDDEIQHTSSSDTAHEGMRGRSSKNHQKSSMSRREAPRSSDQADTWDYTTHMREPIVREENRHHVNLVDHPTRTRSYHIHEHQYKIQPIEQEVAAEQEVPSVQVTAAA